MNDTNWQNLPNTTTPIIAEKLNKLDRVIVNNENVDLNDFTTDGEYYFPYTTTKTNMPSGVANGWLKVMSGSDNNGTTTKQLFYRHGTPNSNDYETYVRTYGASGWGNWTKLLNDKDTGSYTIAEGQYTTAAWATGTNTCTWTAPKTGLYIVWVYYINADDNAYRVYKQFHAKGTATRLVSDVLLYQAGSDSTSESSWNKIAGGTFSTLVYAKAGQTIIPYVHTPVANLKWNVKIVGMFIK